MTHQQLAAAAALLVERSSMAATAGNARTLLAIIDMLGKIASGELILSKSTKE